MTKILKSSIIGFVPGLSANEFEVENGHKEEFTPIEVLEMTCIPYEHRISLVMHEGYVSKTVIQNFFYSVASLAYLWREDSGKPSNVHMTHALHCIDKYLRGFGDDNELKVAKVNLQTNLNSESELDHAVANCILLAIPGNGTSSVHRDGTVLCRYATKVYALTQDVTKHGTNIGYSVLVSNLIFIINKHKEGK